LRCGAQRARAAGAGSRLLPSRLAAAVGRAGPREGGGGGQREDAMQVHGGMLYHLAQHAPFMPCCRLLVGDCAHLCRLSQTACFRG
jgi:hypothetical protein